MAEIARDCKPELGSGLTLTLARGVPGASALLSSHYEQGPWMLWDKDPGWGGLGPNFATDKLCDLGQVTPLPESQTMNGWERVRPKEHGPHV